MSLQRSPVDNRYWFPLGTRSQYGRPEVGTVLAWDHRAWRVEEIRDLPPAEQDNPPRGNPDLPLPIRRDRSRPYAIRLRPMKLINHPDPVKAKANDLHLRVEHYHSWAVFPDPEHYPVCACCADPMPCRDEVGRKMAQEAVDRMSRYETAGVCPACEQPVTGRQKSITFDENLGVLGGPPVTFHLRGKCWGDARRYEKRWAAADPDRTCRLSCPGDLINHGDNTYECTNAADCPGPRAHHRSMSVCRCTSCHPEPYLFGCRPGPTARLRDTPDLFNSRESE